MGRGSPGRLTAGLWDVILHEWFPSQERYANRALYQHSAGYSDILTNHWVARPGGAGPVECRFLIIQVKRFDRQTHPAACLQGANHLPGYMSTTFAQDSFLRCVYGTVAIGRRVRLSKWNDTTSSLNYLSKEHKAFDVVAESARVERYLDHIKGQHDRILRRA